VSQLITEKVITQVGPVSHAFLFSQVIQCHLSLPMSNLQSLLLLPLLPKAISIDLITFIGSFKGISNKLAGIDGGPYWNQLPCNINWNLRLSLFESFSDCFLTGGPTGPTSPGFPSLPGGPGNPPTPAFP